MRPSDTLKQWTEIAIGTESEEIEGTIDFPIRTVHAPPDLALDLHAATATVLDAHPHDAVSLRLTRTRRAIVHPAPAAGRPRSGGGLGARAATTTGGPGHARRRRVVPFREDVMSPGETITEVIEQGRRGGTHMTRTHAHRAHANDHCHHESAMFHQLGVAESAHQYALVATKSRGRVSTALHAATRLHEILAITDAALPHRDATVLSHMLQILGELAGLLPHLDLLMRPTMPRAETLLQPRVALLHRPSIQAERLL